MFSRHPELPAFFLVFLVVPFSLCAQQAPATDAQIWGALVYASERIDRVEDSGGQDVPVLSLGGKAEADLRSRLGKIFVGREFRFLGEHTQGLFKQYESWLVPSREFFLKLDSKGPAEGGGVNLSLQFWQDKKVIMKTDATLRPDSPLFIEGPRWRDGNLVFVVLLK